MPCQEHLANLRIFRSSKSVAYTSGEGWMTIVLQQVQDFLSLYSQSQPAQKKTRKCKYGIKKAKTDGIIIVLHKSVA